MRKILDILLAKLDRKLTEARQNNPYEESVRGWFMFGNYKVSFIFDEDDCYLDIFNVVKETALFNIEDYCTKRCVRWNEIDVPEEPSEWDCNGFASEADYVRYMYG